MLCEAVLLGRRGEEREDHRERGTDEGKDENTYI